MTLATSPTVAPQPQPANLTVEQMKLGITRLQRRVAELEAFDPKSVKKRWAPEVKAIEASIDQALTDTFGHNTIEYQRYRSAATLDHGGVYSAINTDWSRRGRTLENIAAVHRFLADGKKEAMLLLQQAIRGLEEVVADREGLAAIQPRAGEAASPAPDLSKVFIVHGHDGTPKAEVARFIEKLGFEAIILHERPNKGRALITKFREEAAGVGFAVVLMTPDDLGKAEKAVDLNSRARQNVVFELGFFIGKLGPERVAALVKGDIEIPSDFDGVVYISLDKDDWQTKLGGELQEAGFEIDWNKVMRR
jgi:predicted nucleotide-binding protein